VKRETALAILADPERDMTGIEKALALLIAELQLAVASLNEQMTAERAGRRAA
jgi:hypothetical protein